MKIEGYVSNVQPIALVFPNAEDYSSETHIYRQGKKLNEQKTHNL